MSKPENEPDWDDLADALWMRLETELCPSTDIRNAPRLKRQCGACAREMIARVLEMVGRIRDDETLR